MFKSVKQLLMKKRKLWRKEDVEVGNEKMFNKNYFDWLQLEAATGGVLQKKPFLKIPQYLQESTCVGVCF